MEETLNQLVFQWSMVSSAPSYIRDDLLDYMDTNAHDANLIRLVTIVNDFLHIEHHSSLDVFQYPRNMSRFYLKRHRYHLLRFSSVMRDHLENEQFDPLSTSIFCLLPRRLDKREFDWCVDCKEREIHHPRITKLRKIEHVFDTAWNVEDCVISKSLIFNLGESKNEKSVGKETDHEQIHQTHQYRISVDRRRHRRTRIGKSDEEWIRSNSISFIWIHRWELLESVENDKIVESMFKDIRRQTIEAAIWIQFLSRRVWWKDIHTVLKESFRFDRCQWWWQKKNPTEIEPDDHCSTLVSTENSSVQWMLTCC